MINTTFIRHVKIVLPTVCLLLAAGCSTSPIVHDPPPTEPAFGYDRVVADDVALQIDELKLVEIAVVS